MGLRTFRLRKRLLLAASLSMLSTAGGCKQGPWMLWDAYSTRFIDGQGRVIDHSAGDRSTSEGQAYALFFALVDNDRTSFDKVLNWTQVNLADGDLQTHLPSWLWGRDNKGEWKTLDANSASDADVWMAYTLIEAGRLWRGEGYTGTGRKMMAMIAQSEVADLPSFGPLLLPGPVGFQHGNAWTVNPSYMPLFLFERLAVVDPDGPWKRIALGIPRFLRQSSCHGYAMDWVSYVPGDGFYPAIQQRSGQAAAAGQPAGSSPAGAPLGSYDAIRVYLWAGMLNDDKTRTEVLGAIPGMSLYLANHDAPPEKVSELGIPQGADGPVGFSAAMVPYLRALPNLSNLSAKQTIRLSAQRDAATGLYGKAAAYYDQNLALFETGYVEGRFRFGASGELNVEWTR
jgi:endoglucanase